jgi:hypothetical protein
MYELGQDPLARGIASAVWGLLSAVVGYFVSKGIPAKPRLHATGDVRACARALGLTPAPAVNSRMACGGRDKPGGNGQADRQPSAAGAAAHGTNGPE